MRLYACRPTVPIELPSSMRAVHTPLSWQEWDRSLSCHPDQQFRQYIVNGIRQGFRLGFDYAHVIRSSSHNMPSTSEHPQVVSEYLAAECSHGRVVGPVNPMEFPQIHVSRFGVIPKSTEGQWRLIVDLSSPEGASVNAGVSVSLCSLSYVSVQDAARGVVAYGPGALLSKVDVKSAYRMVPVHPDDRWLLGMVWGDQLFVDTVLPFGLRSAPKISQP